MFLRIIVVVFVLGLSALAKEVQDHRIVGGVEAIKNEFPWIVHLNINGTSLCGGSIIDKDWILTAAHCVVNQLNNSTLVTAGDHNRTLTDAAKQVRNSGKIIIHHGYNRNNNQNDIALIKLNTSFALNNQVKAINLPTPSFAPTGSAVVAGWGRSVGGEASTPASDVLRKVNLTIVDWQTCKNRYAATTANITDRQICASDGLKSPCNGDSGGPLMCTERNSVVVCGAVSFGILGCAAGESRPAVFSRISSYIDWIRYEMSETPTTTTPTTTTTRKPSSSSRLSYSVFPLLGVSLWSILFS